ncbi:MAG: A/G-specific adenine glycosylase [Legionella sp.]|nr:A/G-specific adenine glycosylase [Legionella sp.]
MSELNDKFSTPLLKWYEIHGRKNLPWQLPRSPYRVWISEIMLQQTQVQTVIPYFERFMKVFPDIETLAYAQDDEVLALWSGLGYYSRARNLHKTAQIIVNEFASIFPQTLTQLINLPGIGESTAAAILSQAFNQRTAILDGNVKRVLSRFFMISGSVDQAATKRKLWSLADACMPEIQCADYTQAIMDLGATCCTPKNYNCVSCPVNTSCLAFNHGEQENYPTKKVKKQIPTVQKKFLVLTNHDGKIYLEKNPSTGIWGGLWCLPTVDIDECPLRFIREHYDLEGAEPRLLTELKHRFSHFLLLIEAIKIETTLLGTMVKEPQGKWFTQNELLNLGIATPTKKILSLGY